MDYESYENSAQYLSYLLTPATVCLAVPLYQQMILLKKNLAAVACGVFSSVEEAAEKIVRVTETIEPEPELVEKYERQYQKFAKIYPTVKDLFTELL